jgi:hypothetical protein
LLPKYLASLIAPFLIPQTKPCNATAKHEHKARCRLLAFGFWLLASGFWLLASGFWLLALLLDFAVGLSTVDRRRQFADRTSKSQQLTSHGQLCHKKIKAGAEAFLRWQLLAASLGICQATKNRAVPVEPNLPARKKSLRCRFTAGQYSRLLFIGHCWRLFFSLRRNIPKACPKVSCRAHL